MYLTDLHQIFRFGRTLSVDDRSEVSFSIPQGTLLWQPIFADYRLLSAELGSPDIRQMATYDKVQLLRWTQANRLTDQN